MDSTPPTPASAHTSSPSPPGSPSSSSSSSREESENIPFHVCLDKIPKKYYNTSARIGVRISDRRMWTVREHIVVCDVIADVCATRSVEECVELFGRKRLVESIVGEVPMRLNVAPADVLAYLGVLGFRTDEAVVPGPTPGGEKVYENRNEPVCIRGQTTYVPQREPKRVDPDNNTLFALRKAGEVKQRITGLLT